MICFPHMLEVKKFPGLTSPRHINNWSWRKAQPNTWPPIPTVYTQGILWVHASTIQCGICTNNFSEGDKHHLVWYPWCHLFHQRHFIHWKSPSQPVWGSPAPTSTWSDNEKGQVELLKTSVEYLGHCIDAEIVHTTASKLKAIEQAAVPPNVQELRLFFGGILYYHTHPWFVHHLCTNWTDYCSKDACESDLQSVVKPSRLPKRLWYLLVYLHISILQILYIKLAADTSAYGIGVVILHTFTDGNESPIVFASHSLSSSEMNYAQLEKEE